MNRPVLRDKKWWLYLLITMLVSIAAIVLAAIENQFWIVALILSISFSVVGVKRANNLMHGTKD